MRTWQHEPSSLKREKIKEKTGERVPRRTMDYQRHWEAAEAWPTTALPDGSAKGHVKGILCCGVTLSEKLCPQIPNPLKIYFWSF